MTNRFSCATAAWKSRTSVSCGVLGFSADLSTNSTAMHRSVGSSAIASRPRVD